MRDTSWLVLDNPAEGEPDRLFVMHADVRSSGGARVSSCSVPELHDQADLLHNTDKNVRTARSSRSVLCSVSGLKAGRVAVRDLVLKQGNINVKLPLEAWSLGAREQQS